MKTVLLEVLVQEIRCLRHGTSHVPLHLGVAQVAARRPTVAHLGELHNLATVAKDLILKKKLQVVAVNIQC